MEMYVMQMMANVSHHKCGAECMHVSTDVNTRMCAVTNQVRPRRVESSLSLPRRVSERVRVWSDRPTASRAAAAGGDGAEAVRLARAARRVRAPPPVCLLKDCPAASRPPHQRPRGPPRRCDDVK
jgi:hypothetical protein